MRALSILIAAGFLIVGSPAVAKYVQSSKARYQTSDGPSVWYTVDVTFVTGAELNNATQSLNYDELNGRYAIIFWGEDQATVIKLDGSEICGLEFDNSCLPLAGRSKGPDQEGRIWDICTGIYCS